MFASRFFSNEFDLFDCQVGSRFGSKLASSLRPAADWGPVGGYWREVLLFGRRSFSTSPPLQPLLSAQRATVSFLRLAYVRHYSPQWCTVQVEVLEAPTSTRLYSNSRWTTFFSSTRTDCFFATHSTLDPFVTNPSVSKLPFTKPWLWQWTTRVNPKMWKKCVSKFVLEMEEEKSRKQQGYF